MYKHYSMTILLCTGLFITLLAQGRVDSWSFSTDNIGLSLTNHKSDLTGLVPMNRNNRRTQLFLLEKVGNGKVLIASGNSKNHFLQRQSDGEVILTAFKKKEQDTFEWKISYAGFPYAVLTDPENSLKVLTLENGMPVMKKVKGLLNNTDPAGDPFRFSMKAWPNHF